MITIYGFLEGPAPDGGWEVTATCECGTRLVRHIVERAEDAAHAIGVNSQEQHALYQAHCVEQHHGEPFHVEWIDDPSNYQGLHQSDIEVISWSEDELSALADQLRAAFPAHHENSSKPPEDIS